MNAFTRYIMALSLLATGACTKGFLQVEDVTNVSEQTFYRTPEDAYRALVGVYDGLQIVWAEGVSLPVATELFSDNCFGGTGASDGFGYQMLDEFDRLRSPSDQNIFGANWAAYYRALHRANTLLIKLDDIDWEGNESLRPIYEAETRFLRAYLYFDMVRLWENIPLLTEPSAENLPQAHPDEVYGVIAEDLQFATANLPTVSFSANNPNAGRVTKWAAQSLLARVFLYYTGYYGKADLVGMVSKAEALAAVEDVISNSGHGLVDDYAKLWPAASIADYVGEDNMETVFAIKYTYTSDYDGNTDGNHWMVMVGMREQWSYPYGNGWGGATVNPKLWNAYSDDDTRKVASIIAVEEEGVNFTNLGGQREYTGYYVKKYSPMVDEEGNSLVVLRGGENFMIGQYQDYVAIRYADVLLMAAELGSANAQVYFDEVRRRAYKSGFSALLVNNANLLRERQLEFAFEGIRYWDLLRQGVETAANEIAETTTVRNGGAEVTKTISASKITETRGVQQLPYTQITLSNGVLKQNPGW
ncbi:RagB/SusD family nutrient uptake outer membrane protein [Parapedobacter tibetensis]|uniref:RagB/SusD family nutrient uptake outer membrane protein n=1 Tax=Parapedobacter tibetensis TaxID=2972951 RepID=UPI00214DD346|nr:RagB/SusD family nutrient uptake outer membrane protein [Parapedobacter tibetensis]